ncbi:MAG: cache domain-containing protein, partial [Ruminococcus sp.]|nr:cache domain-containing protein [Ruminococcus sp.]
FTDKNGVDYASDGRTADARQRGFYNDGISGNNGIEIIYDPYFFDESMICFYSSVCLDEQIIGVLRGAFLAEEYLKNMLTTTYFGENAQVFLCSRDGRVIADSENIAYTGQLSDILTEKNMIDVTTVKQIQQVFENGDTGVFVCDNSSKVDNVYVTYLSDNNLVFVQTFPKNVTQTMIEEGYSAVNQLEIMLVVMFIVYITIVFICSGRKHKQLETENQEMGYIISGVNTLFTRFVMVDFEKNTYHYLAGTKSLDGMIPSDGPYQMLINHFIQTADDAFKQDVIDFMDRNSIVEAMSEHNDLRHELHVIRNGRSEWEHINVVCLERKDGRAVKAMFTRQNTTEIKEKELRIQEERSRANRKERQYQVAIMSNSFCNCEFNLTKDLIEQEIVGIINGKQISFLSKLNMTVPCKVSDFFEAWKQYVLPESLESYSDIVNTEYLLKRFEQGEREVVAEYWSKGFSTDLNCVRQSFAMAKDDNTGDIMVMVISKDITEQVKQRREQTQA